MRRAGWTLAVAAVLSAGWVVRLAEVSPLTKPVYDAVSAGNAAP